jgi:hypothetical protein
VPINLKGYLLVFSFFMLELATCEITINCTNPRLTAILKITFFVVYGLELGTQLKFSKTCHPLGDEQT